MTNKTIGVIMSADNGFYIAEFDDGWRWTYAFAIENIEHYIEGTEEYDNVILDYFGKSRLYDNKENAFADAVEAYNNLLKQDKHAIVEYGVCFINKKLKYPHYLVK